MTTASVDTRAFSPFEWLLAGRYLRARRTEGFISVIAGFSFLGILLGVATLIVVMAVMNGFRKELFDKIIGLNGHVIVNKIGGPFEDYDAVAKRIATVAGVRHALPLIEGQAMVSTPAQATGALVRGLTEEGVKSLALVAGSVQQGTFDNFDQSGGVAIGTRLADKLRIARIGDQITVIQPRGAATPFGTSPRIKTYPVVAIFELGMSEYDRTVLFMPFEESQRFFNRGASADVVEVLVDDADQVAQRTVVLRGLGDTSLHFSDWRQRNQTFINVLDLERTMM